MTDPKVRFLVLYKAISFPLEIGSKLISTDEKKAPVFVEEDKEMLRTLGLYLLFF